MATPDGYSAHFSRRELLFSETAVRHGIDNTPGPLIERNLVRLCTDLLEPIRQHFGAIAISSGYRCPALNAAVRGSKTSAHVEGRAADLRPVEPTISLTDVVRWVQASGLPYDQVIYEFGSWVHVAVAASDGAARHQALMIFEPEKYAVFDPANIPAERIA